MIQAKKLLVVLISSHSFGWNASLNIEEVVVVTNAFTVWNSDPWFTFPGFPFSLVSIGCR